MAKPSKKTTEQFNQEIIEKGNNEYILLSEYKGTNEKVLLKHKNCGHEYYVTPNKFLQGRRCPNCNKFKTKKTTSDFIKEFHEKRGYEYTILGEYKTKNDKITVRHEICGKKFDAIAANLIRTNNPTGCPYCSKNHKYTTEEYRNLIKIKFNNEFELMSEYKDKKTEVLIRHNRCNNILVKFPDKIRKDIFCPYCNSSLGEQKINTYLTNNSYSFTIQKIFDDLIDKDFLKYDFCLILENKIILIEYDGQLHFNDIEFIKIV